MTTSSQLKAVIAAREKASARLSIVLQTRGYTIIDTDYKPDDVKFYNIASAFFLTDAPKLVAEIERYRAALQKCSAHTSRTEKTLKAECIAALTGKGENGMLTWAICWLSAAASKINNKFADPGHLVFIAMICDVLIFYFIGKAIRP